MAPLSVQSVTDRVHRLVRHVLSKQRHDGLRRGLQRHSGKHERQQTGERSRNGHHASARCAAPRARGSSRHLAQYTKLAVRVGRSGLARRDLQQFSHKACRRDEQESVTRYSAAAVCVSTATQLFAGEEAKQLVWVATLRRARSSVTSSKTALAKRCSQSLSSCTTSATSRSRRSFSPLRENGVAFERGGETLRTTTTSRAASRSSPSSARW